MTGWIDAPSLYVQQPFFAMKNRALCLENELIIVQDTYRNKRFGIKDDSHAHANDSCIVTLLIMILSDTFQHLEFTKILLTSDILRFL